MPEEYWVEAELSEARERGGHCYLELVERAEGSITPVAKAQAKCWRNTWSLVKPAFERATGQTIHAGMKVLMKVYADFHEAYGFSWIVTDIDPNYTLGDIQRRRLEIIAQLKEEGIFDLNKSMPLPLFCQNIAIISSEGAAGYGDFCNQLQNNDYGFCFRTELFSATMQGNQVEPTVIAALERIYQRIDDFHCVVIIRGGGATSDLSGFDTLALAENVANFPLPIITGIGHERDETIIDMVAHTRVKTPTAAAALLIGNLKDVADRIDSAALRISRTVSGRMERERLRLEQISSRLPSIFAIAKTRQEARIDQLFTRLANGMLQNIERQQHQIELLSRRASSLDPELPLKRGYSITMHKGKIVRRAADLNMGDEIETRLAEGTLKSTITKS